MCTIYHTPWLWWLAKCEGPAESAGPAVLFPTYSFNSSRLTVTAMPLFFLAYVVVGVGDNKYWGERGGLTTFGAGGNSRAGEWVAARKATTGILDVVQNDGSFGIGGPWEDFGAGRRKA